MHEEIIKQLKTLKNVTPDTGFISRTRKNFILPIQSSKQAFSLFSWQYASVFAAILIVIFALPFFFIPEPTLASLDSETISKEVHALPINIQLKEVRYDESVQNTISDAISEASNTDINHLNKSLLEKEKNLSLQTKNNEIEKNVDDLLNEVIK